MKLIFLYACELWTLTAELEKRMQAFEMRSYQRLLNITYKDHVTNEEVHGKIYTAIGYYDDCLTQGLLFSLLFSKDNHTGRNRRKQKKRWEDNINEWTAMDFASTTKAAENRTRWKEIVAKSSVVP